MGGGVCIILPHSMNICVGAVKGSDFETMSSDSMQHISMSRQKLIKYVYLNEPGSLSN
jgi:hypothetical protein